MNLTSMARLGAGLALSTLLLIGCGGGGGGGGGDGTARGMTAVVIKDAPGTVANEIRTYTSLIVTITEVRLVRADSGDGEHENEDEGIEGDHDDEDEGIDDEDEGIDDEHDDGEDDGDEGLVDDHDGEDEDEGIEDDDEENDDNGGRNEEVVVFSGSTDVDLPTLSDVGVIISTLGIPVGRYDRVKVTLASSATIVFDDAPTVPETATVTDTEVTLDFDPEFTVDAGTMNVVQADLVALVTNVGTLLVGPYEVAFDEANHDSGENDEASAELEGRVTSVNGTTIVIAGVTIDIAGISGVTVAVGDRVEVEGNFLNGVLIATELELEDDDD